MQTHLFKAYFEDGTWQLPKIDLEFATELLKAGELVVFPTETVYGLGALANQPQALANIFTVKGRPQDNPLILHVDSLKMLKLYTSNLSKAATTIITKLMPGPLTLILPKNAAVNDLVSANLPTVGLRIPKNPIARALITCAGQAIAAPSANISGRPSPTNSQAVIEDFFGKVAGIIDGGASAFGVESTILDLSVKPYRILRPGAISAEKINLILQEAGCVERVICQNDFYLPNLKNAATPKAPGMKYRHYAPNADVKILPTDEEFAIETLKEYLEQYNGQVVSAYTSVTFYEKLQPKYKEAVKFWHFFEDFELPDYSAVAINSEEKLAYQAANGLFSSLREADRQGANCILVQALAGQGMAQAYMNRLTKAEKK